MTDSFVPTDRSRVRRKPARGAYDAATVHAILDEALVCHVGFAMPHGPVVIPTTHVRLADQLYIHGSAASHMLGRLATGAEVCVTVTLLDALVLSRTAFHHSVNYRSVVVFGRAAIVDDEVRKREALAALLDKLVAGRSTACREPNAKELAATTVIAVPIAEASAKIRQGPPLVDEADDARLPYWAGIVPLRVTRGTPESAPDCTLAPPGTLVA
jgi:nitroimidazol reductase NimA-like FMN-containing flavoprotein (pyridoxamine 5'-phosphate oxidase superfamily)